MNNFKNNFMNSIRHSYFYSISFKIYDNNKKYSLNSVLGKKLILKDIKNYLQNNSFNIIKNSIINFIKTNTINNNIINNYLNFIKNNDNYLKYIFNDLVKNKNKINSHINYIINYLKSKQILLGGKKSKRKLIKKRK